MSSDRILKNLLRFNDLKGDVTRMTQEIAKCKGAWTFALRCRQL
jgi:hypothetical protein